MAELPPKVRAGMAEAASVLGNQAGIALPARYDDLTRRGRAAAREAYVEQQGGKCAHCGEPLDGPCADRVACDWINWNLFPPGFMNHRVHLHHDHRTGLTIGAIHAYCNAWLWQYRKE